MKNEEWLFPLKQHVASRPRIQVHLRLAYIRSSGQEQVINLCEHAPIIYVATGDGTFKIDGDLCVLICTYDDEDGAYCLNFPCQGYGIQQRHLWPMVYVQWMVDGGTYIVHKHINRYIFSVMPNDAKQMPNTNWAQYESTCKQHQICTHKHVYTCTYTEYLIASLELYCHLCTRKLPQGCFCRTSCITILCSVNYHTYHFICVCLLLSNVVSCFLCLCFFSTSFNLLYYDSRSTHTLSRYTHPHFSSLHTQRTPREQEDPLRSFHNDICLFGTALR